jgi:hypothetical protein
LLQWLFFEDAASFGFRGPPGHHRLPGGI